MNTSIPNGDASANLSSNADKKRASAELRLSALRKRDLAGSPLLNASKYIFYATIQFYAFVYFPVTLLFLLGNGSLRFLG